MKKSNVWLSAILICLTTLLSCSGRVEPTTVIVEDPIRHYYPILEGDELQIVYDIWNTGRNPLVISEIQTSCGCITYDDTKRIVPPGDKERLTFRYDSSKNRGLVSHQIRLYGNFDSQSMMLLEFDVYVVPPSADGTDYEETLSKKEREERTGSYYVEGEYDFSF